MERIEMIERAAAALQARLQRDGVFGADRVELLCAALGLTLQQCPGSDVMLGGAYSRLWSLAAARRNRLARGRLDSAGDATERDPDYPSVG